ncbi:hypothetical protein CAPTEDRAFT_220711 [Capitella teleta]|uniref:Fibronectin type-III domain-containing protein n=1 Tax=Capitella teleta TaxID=283909 RepID=R7VFN1_CAPTE|nr:hypothetical protein CAPTEDRAFT_220711 [Capitella teleta]|eukprot:ELU17382.1 hypothetical protein CAPTEDRAFT_220711 [Capitella teleta]
MSFTWSPPANPGKIDYYEYFITISGATTPEIERSGKIAEYYHQLSAGKTYIIEVRAVTNNQRGLPASLTFTMIPNDPGNVREMERGQSYLKIEFDAPWGTYDGFEVTWVAKGSGPSSVADFLVTSYNDDSITVEWEKPTGTTVNGFTISIDPPPSEPKRVLSLSANYVSTDSISFSWEVDQSSSQDNFKITYEVTGSGTEWTRERTFTQGQLQYSYLIEGLSAGSTYSISVSAKKSSVQSDPVEITQTIQPKSVRELKAAVIPSGISLSWLPGFDSTQNSYRYQYQGRNVKLNIVPWVVINSESVDLQNLFPGEQYQFYVDAISNDQYSPYNQSTLATTYPLPPTDLTVDRTATTVSSVRVQWKDDLTHSYITSWDIKIADRGTDNIRTIGSTYERTNLDYEIPNLTAGKNYTVYVYGKSGNQRSRDASTVDVTATVPNCVTRPGAVYTTVYGGMQDKEPLRFIDKLSEKYIVEKLGGKIVRTNTANQPPWSQVREQLPMPPYFAVNRCPDLFAGDNKCWLTSRRKRNVVEPGARVQFTVGGDMNCGIGDESYCNGPVQPESTYYVAVVGYTENGLHAVGPFSDPIRTGMVDSKGVNIVAVVIGVVLGTFLLIFIAISLFLFLRKKRASRQDEVVQRPNQEGVAPFDSDPTGAYEKIDQTSFCKESGPLYENGLPPLPTSATSPDSAYEAIDVNDSKYNNNGGDDIYNEITDITHKP